MPTFGINSAWLDGEIVVLRDNGMPDFYALQNAFDRRTSAGIVYFLFGVPFFDGYDLRQATLRDRRTFLESFLAGRGTDNVRVSARRPSVAPGRLRRSPASRTSPGYRCGHADAN